MRLSKVFVAVLTVFTVFSTFLVAETGEKKQVYEVIDADTVRVENIDEHSVRIIGADAPETFGENQPEFFDLENNEENRRCLDEVAREADNYVAESLENEKVVLKADPWEGPVDHYDRRLAYVGTENGMLEKKLLEKGYATVFPTDFRFEREFRELERVARQKEKGVWGC